jgi:hypothetical protein
LKHFCFFVVENKLPKETSSNSNIYLAESKSRVMNALHRHIKSLDGFIEAGIRMFAP